MPLLLGLGLIWLTGCATVPGEEAPPTAEATVAETEAGVEVAEEKGPAPRPKPEDYPVAPFEGDALYELLVAEVAGYRSQYDVALEKYISAARETQDPGVAARAARLAAYMKKPQTQLEMTRIWLSKEPDHIEARRMAFDVLLNSNQLAEAIEHMEKIKELGGLANFEVFAYRASGLDEEGLKALYSAIEEMRIRHPEDTQLAFAAAVVLQQMGRLEEALELTELFITEDEGHNAIVLKASLLSDLGREDEAAIFMREKVEVYPDNRRLRLMFARLLFELEDLVAAREQYEEVLKLSPNDGDILFALALIALELKDDEEAKRHFERMVRWNRRTGEAHYYLGGIAERQLDVVTALREYSQVGNGYEFIPAQARIAALLADDGRWEEARDHLARKRAEHPARSYQLTLIEAQLLTERGLQEEVFDFLDKTLAEDPENTDLLYFRAMTGQKFDRLDILERDLRAIIDIDPDNADALNALGYTLTDQTDRHEEALVLIEKALAIKPGEAAFIDSMGWVQYRLQNYEEALVHLRRALELFPNDEVAAHLGEVLWVTGEKEEANQVWEEALERTPDSEILKNVIKRFREEE